MCPFDRREELFPLSLPRLVRFHSVPSNFPCRRVPFVSLPFASFRFVLINALARSKELLRLFPSLFALTHLLHVQHPFTAGASGGPEIGGPYFWIFLDPLFLDPLFLDISGPLIPGPISGYF